MLTQLIKSTTFFQELLSSQFRTLKQHFVHTLVFLSTCHLFGLTNPNQVADALSIPKTRLYRELNTMSLYLWQHLFVRIGCSIALEVLQEAVSKSAASLSRLCIVISVDDTFVFRYGEGLAYTSNWWSSQAKQPMKGQNILGIVLKIGNQIIPLNMRLVSKQGRGNTDKPSCVITMFKEVVSFFEETGIDIRNYPITFDAWYGSHHLIDTLREMGFETILVHGKSNYVMTIDEKKVKLSEHKKSIKLLSNQWGCDKPVYRTKATSPTFGKVVVLFLADRGKVRTMLVFGKPLRACEILRIWSQHHGIEQYWRYLKTDLNLASMSLKGRNGAYANLGVKVMSYLLIQQVSRSVRKTFHQGQLELSGQRQMLSDLSEHFHEQIPRKH